MELASAKIMRKPSHWQRGEFSKAVVIYCIRWMTAVLVWAIIVTTIATVTDKTVYLTEVLTFASAFFGGELCLLALKRILAKERKDNGEMDTDYQSDHSDCDGIDYDVSDPVPAEEDDADGMGDDAQYY